MRKASAALLAVAASAVAASGCGLGPGDSEGAGGEASLRVTRDYGRELIAEATAQNPSESDTVIRLLDREATVETRFGGGFVQSIDGLPGVVEAGRSLDWFFYVNGIESSVGAAEVPVEAGDRIWWDYRDWTDVMRVPAVVGSFPEPLAQESASNPEPVRLECAGAEEACAAAGEQLAEADVDFTNERFEPGAGAGEMRLLVGKWEDLREDETAALLEEDAEASGVFARMLDVGRDWAVVGLDPAEIAEDQLGGHGGLVAALRSGDEPPVWVVTGTDRIGLDSAVRALEEPSLRDHYALAVLDGEPVPLPREAGEE